MSGDVIVSTLEQSPRPLATDPWEQWFGQEELGALVGRQCKEASVRPISGPGIPTDLFAVWTGMR